MSMISYRYIYIYYMILIFSSQLSDICIPQYWRYRRIYIYICIYSAYDILRVSYDKSMETTRINTVSLTNVKQNRHNTVEFE